MHEPSEPVLCYDSTCRTSNVPDAIWCRKCSRLLCLARRYSILGRVAGNAMWDLYRAWDRESGSNVMLKCYSPMRPRAQREIFLGRLARQKKIPHLIHVMDEVDMDGRKFVVHDHLEGESLKNLLNLEDISLSFTRKLGIASNLCLALRSLHSLAAVHGDLTPDNIHVGRENHLTILNLGAIDQDSAAHFIDESLYDPAYLAPEMLFNGYIPSPSADIFSLGVILHELFHAGPPHDLSPLEDYPRDSPEYRREMCEIKSTRVDHYIRCPEAPHPVRAPLTGAIRACLDPAPEKRPYSADLAERLAQCEQIHERHIARHIAAYHRTSHKNAGTPREGSLIKGPRDTHYQLLERVASGPLSFRCRQYRARRTDDEGIVEINLFPSQDMIADRWEIQQFLVESWALMRLVHPNVIKVYDVGMLCAGEREAHAFPARPVGCSEVPDESETVSSVPITYFFQAKEFFPYPTLKDYLASAPGKRIPTPRAVNIMLEVCRGVTYIAHGSVVDFEVRPAHISLGEHDEVRLLDSGIRISSSKPDDTEARDSYLAPEETGGEINERIYIYHLGSMFYSMVTGIPVFADMSRGIAARDMKKHLRKMRKKKLPTRPCVVEPSVPGNVNDIIMTMLQRNPTKRFANLKQTLTILEKAREDLS